VVNAMSNPNANAAGGDAYPVKQKITAKIKIIFFEFIDLPAMLNLKYF
jgi:hypothetical protein